MALEKELRDAVEAFAAQCRQSLDAQLRSLTENLVRAANDREGQGRLEIERAVSQAREEAERAAQSRLESMRAELTREMAARSSLATFTRFLAAIRRLDEARSLHAILEALSEGAAARAARAAILLIDGARLRVWGHQGFSPTAVPQEIAAADAAVVTAAIALRKPSLVKPAGDDRDRSLPAFMRVPAGHTGLVLPIVVGTEVVAVLYADAADPPAQPAGAPAWTDEVDILVKHASLRLESVTSVRTVELLSSPA